MDNKVPQADTFWGVAQWLKDIIQEICASLDIQILGGHVPKDHVHLFISMPPHISASEVMQKIKGKISRKMLTEFRWLSRLYWGRHLWARGNFVSSSGNVTDEVILQYIQLQDVQECVHDDDFTLAQV